MLQSDLNYSASKCRQTILAGTNAERKAAAQNAFDKGRDAIQKDTARLKEFAPRWVLQENRDRLVAIREQLPEIRREQQATIDTAASGERDAVVRAGNNYADKITP